MSERSCASSEERRRASLWPKLSTHNFSGGSVIRGELWATSKSRRSLKNSRRFGRPVCNGCPRAWYCRLGRSGSGARKRASRRRRFARQIRRGESDESGRSKPRTRVSSASGDGSATGQFFNVLWPALCIEGDNLVRFIQYAGHRGDTRWIAAEQQSGTAV